MRKPLSAALLGERAGLTERRTSEAELARHCSVMADKEQELSFLVKYLHIAESSIYSINMSCRTI